MLFTITSTKTGNYNYLEQEIQASSSGFQDLTAVIWVTAPEANKSDAILSKMIGIMYQVGDLGC